MSLAPSPSRIPTAVLDKLDEAVGAWKPYSAYHQTATKWLGPIPAAWTLTRLKFCVSGMQSGGTPDTHRDEYWSIDESGTAWVAIGDMTRAEVVDGTDKRLTTAGLASKKLPVLPAGTLLYSMYASLGKVAVLGIPATVNQAILGVVPDANLAVRDFLRYWLIQIERHLEHFSNSNTQDNLNATKVRNMPVYLPPLPEQRAIAAFLDDRTRRIDELIEKKRRLLDLLQEQRTALITRAVTKGLDPAAPMKPSGIDWLGDVPRHWEVCFTKRVATLRTGHTPSRKEDAYWVDCTIPWFGLVDVWQLRSGRQEYLGETNEKISQLGLDNSAADLLPAGTVVVSRTASVGFSGIMPVPMATTQDFVNWISGPRMTPEYLLYVFRAMRPVFDSLTNGSTHKTIYMPDVYRFVTPVPPVAEQQAIVAHIREQAERIAAMEDAATAAIDRLMEYRQALISAAVTGAIDVRERTQDA